MGTYVPTSQSSATDTGYDVHGERPAGSPPATHGWLDFARDRPLTTLFAAFLGGFLMGRMFGRR